MKAIDLNTLKQAVGGNIAAIRTITRLEPAGGSGDKVFPPTYMKEGRAETKYATEERRIGGRTATTVLLDSVASQANRMEEALLEAWHRKELSFPVVTVDFSKDPELADLGEISALQAPHRIADALLRDSTLDGRPFRHSPVGRAFTDSRPNHATGMYLHCPTALVFGVWDSTGPKGGLGAKFQRALVSEIVGVDVVVGVKTSSRIDPAGIERKAAGGEVYRHRDPEQEWTLDAKEAAQEKNKPAVAGKDGTPAAVNHGNIPPTLDREAGGVTMDHALQTTVLSLPALRRIRFLTNAKNEPIAADARDRTDAAGRTALAALALAAIVYQRENGFDLRSRSLLVPTGPLVFELVGRDGGEPERRSLSREQASTLLKEAEAEARDLGLGWDRGPVTLTPSPKLVTLIKRSRALKQAGKAEEA